MSRQTKKYTTALKSYHLLGNKGEPDYPTLYGWLESIGYQWDSKTATWIQRPTPKDATPTGIVRIRVLGTLSETTQTIDKLKAQFNVVETSEPYANRNDDGVRFYLTVRL